MQKPLLLTLLCMILAGCDNPKSLDFFTPEMASFSYEFYFDLLRRPVKVFS
ncbi:YnfC family lipoprotein, partial [Salmonella enterica subsp. enterica serovar Typhimurium]